MLETIEGHSALHNWMQCVRKYKAMTMIKEHDYIIYCVLQKGALSFQFEDEDDDDEADDDKEEQTEMTEPKERLCEWQP